MGKETCWKCHGRRFTVCHTCGGSGKARGTATTGDETKAGGGSSASCPGCHGTGSIKCELCKGTGYLET
jgi:hypothetical protein